MIYNLILPLYLLTAPLTLDDGHKINAPLLKSGEVSKDSGFLISIGDIADIQATLRGNSCMIRVAEIKDRFVKEQGLAARRCSDRLKQIQDTLDESQLLNKRLTADLEEERVFSKRLLYGVTIGGVILTTASVLLYKK
jgi:hypothetical protein